ncbi:MAG: 7-cyano-7-deazaguanine synthase QueC [bacterium]
MSSKNCIVLLSGGLDSTTTLYYAKNKGYNCRALIFDYGQRHVKEIRSAVRIARAAKIPYQIIRIKLPWKGSSLLDKTTRIPANRIIGKKIPSTYVPGRNTIFLSFAVSYAESIGADAVFIGANAVDFSGYPDCRPEYYKVFRTLIQKGTKAKRIKIVTPLIKMTKSQIIKLGLKLGAPLELTWSCYKGGRHPCGVCDSCRLRRKGFREIRTRH